MFSLCGHLRERRKAVNPSHESVFSRNFKFIQMNTSIGKTALGYSPLGVAVFAIAVVVVHWTLKGLILNTFIL